jgi:hypothetical protein
MSDEATAFCLAAFFFFVGLTCGCNGGTTLERRAAIAAGVAEWQVDPRTGETSFHYRTKGESP